MHAALARFDPAHREEDEAAVPGPDALAQLGPYVSRRLRRTCRGRPRWARPRASRPYSSRRIARHCSLTTSTRSGSTIAWRWQSIRAAVVKSSTWCTVRTTVTGAPASRTRAAARAAMQSWACRMSKRSASSASPPASVSIEAKHALVERRSDLRRPGEHGVRHGGRPEEADRGIAEGHQVHGDALPVQRLGQAERVHETAPRLGRVRDEGQTLRRARSQRHRRELGLARGERGRGERRPGRGLGDDAADARATPVSVRRSPAGPGRCPST